MHDLETAWDEGWTSSEILKRYTTATMGPCQGALCSRHLAAFSQAKGAAPPAAGTHHRASSGPRTAARRPHRRGARSRSSARTALHDRHVAAGARMDRSGVWMRPATYGDVAGEIRAVRERVSVMDVSTLGKFLVAGRDARALLDCGLPAERGRDRARPVTLPARPRRGRVRDGRRPARRASRRPSY